MSSSSSWADIVAQDTSDKSTINPQQKHGSDNSDQHDHHQVQHASSNQDDTGSDVTRPSPLGDFPLPQETVQDSETTLPSAGVGDLLNQSTESIKTESTMERSYAFVTDFPPPQAAAPAASSGSHADVPTSSGVGDLLHTNKDGDNKADPTTPPHPDRSFASVAGNKDFPDLHPSISDAPSASSAESLSDLPDVKDMLSSRSVKIPPPPSSKSFAKMAAKPAPVEEVPSDHRLATEKQNAEIASHLAPDPSQKTHENFPTLAQSNMMAEHGASSKERGMFTAISELSQSVDAATADEALPDKTTANKKTFADVTGSNLDKAPPSASPRPVEQHPVYDEDDFMKESARKEMRKWRQREPDEETTPEMEQIVKKHSEVEKEKNAKETLDKQIQFFDKRGKGKITFWDTFNALRRLGYWWFTAIPTTLLLHLRLSPFTSHHRFPFIYRSFSDLFTLPIYTDRLGQALATQLPMSGLSKARQLVRKHGRAGPEGSRGIGFWAGFWGMADIEGYRWWQVAPWHIASRLIHRAQWFFAYTMLQDPRTHLVTESSLSSLPA